MPVLTGIYYIYPLYRAPRSLELHGSSAKSTEDDSDTGQSSTAGGVEHRRGRGGTRASSRRRTRAGASAGTASGNGSRNKAGGGLDTGGAGGADGGGAVNGHGSTGRARAGGAAS